MTWKIVAASATGSSHAATDMPCQDAYDWCCNEDWLIAVVCDGAGSAPFSDRGARHGAQSLCRQLFSALPVGDTAPADPHSYWTAQIEFAVEKTRISLETQCAREGRSLKDFHATIVGVIMGPQFGTFFQIGDGIGVALCGEGWDDSVVALPENGEYADETYFYTEGHWREHLRFTPVPPEARLITLMTDGAMSFAMAPGQQGLDVKFMEPVTRFLDSVNGETGRRALFATLDDKRTHAITSDDKTLLWARREAAAEA